MSKGVNRYKDPTYPTYYLYIGHLAYIPHIEKCFGYIQIIYFFKLYSLFDQKYHDFLQIFSLSNFLNFFIKCRSDPVFSEKGIRIRWKHYRILTAEVRLRNTLRGQDIYNQVLHIMEFCRARDVINININSLSKSIFENLETKENRLQGEQVDLSRWLASLWCVGTQEIVKSR